MHKATTLLLACLSVIIAGGAFVGLAATGLDDTDRPPEVTAWRTPHFQIGPIDGLTTDWHQAPPATSVPLGAILTFFQPASFSATVTWFGAEEIARTADGSTAICLPLDPGEHIVRVEVTTQQVTQSQCVLNAVDILIDQIGISPIEPWIHPVEVDEQLPPDELNEQTMSYYFGESIARFIDVGGGAYRTSVRRTIYASVDVEPPGFAPLMEWRVDGEPVQLGSTSSWYFESDDVANHVIEVGPTWDPEGIEIETYRVTIVSHTSNEDEIPEGEPIVFYAETDPPGYEADITWLSSTKHGTGVPVLGEGPVFVAEFNDTWGVGEDGHMGQWLGVRADNTAFGQDGKQGACCLPDGSCESNVSDTECAAAQGAFFRDLDCADVNCPPPPPVGACCLPVGSCVGPVTKGICDAQQGTFFEGLDCAQVDCLGACCVANSICFENVAEITCDVLLGDFFRGQDCAAIDCLFPGVCCLPNGNCIENADVIECFEEGGFYIPLVDCDDVACEPLGACCLDIDVCVGPVTEAFCGDLLGTWLENEDCANVQCAPLGACCLGIFGCADGWTEAQCDFLVGTFFQGQLCADVNCPPPAPR